MNLVTMKEFLLLSLTLPLTIHSFITKSISTFKTKNVMISNPTFLKMMYDNDIVNHKVFCNVELNGAAVEAVGFDMDFTLAQYKQEFDLLAFEGAKVKLYEKLGYPEDILNFQYNPDAFRRGLIIDKSEGNVLKVDRHKYHRKVYHGLEELNTQARKASKYSEHVFSYTENEFAVIDTLFLLVDAVLFAHLVEFRDKQPHLLRKSYDQIYKDIRSCVDMCHRDGVIKDAVMANPSKFIIYDENLVPMLHRYKQEGKKTFLLTNSMWEYTNAVMSYLVYGEGEYNKHIPTWESLFDIVIVGASKPSFLTDDYLALFQIEKDGLLRNIEDKTGLKHKVAASDGNYKVFQGGHWKDLEKLLSVSAGDKILYVGDHLYSDILKSKRKLGWRTCLIIPELDRELHIGMQSQDLAQKILRLRQLQYDLDEYMDLLRQRERIGTDIRFQLAEAEKKANELKQDIKILSSEYDGRFNKMWGPLFKAGFKDSRFAKQVCDYACLYTSRASNLGLVDPNKMFRTTQAFMPHDQVAQDSEQFHSNDYAI